MNVRKHEFDMNMNLNLMNSFEYEYDPYKVLNVSPFSNDSEIESAYKKLVLQFHPDKTLNMGPDLRKLSEDKMKEINAAYDDIKKQRKRYNAKF